MVTLETRFILVPEDIRITELGLRPSDIFTYVTLRSYYNSFTKLCNPSLETVAIRAGVRRQCITASLLRLERAQLIEITRSGKKRVGNTYKFPEIERFYQVPYSIFEANDLTVNEKGLLVCLRSVFESIGLRAFEEKPADLKPFLHMPVKKIAIALKMLYKKGYLEKRYSQYDKLKKRGTTYLSDKINWNYKEPLPVSYIGKGKTIIVPSEDGKGITFLYEPHPLEVAELAAKPSRLLFS